MCKDSVEFSSSVHENCFIFSPEIDEGFIPRGNVFSFQFFILRTAIESKNSFFFFFLCWLIKISVQLKRKDPSSYHMLIIFIQQIKPWALRGLCWYEQFQWLLLWACRCQWAADKVPPRCQLAWDGLKSPGAKRRQKYSSFLPACLSVSLTIVLAPNITAGAVEL